MPVEKPRPGLADYVAIALSPALIIGLIVSLVYFLVAVLYDGDFVGRLQWGLFWLVLGLVLVARISMEYGISDRAPLYGVVLAFCGWLALGRFVEMPPALEALGWLVNAILILLIWWSAYKLVWDCTAIDERAVADSAGLLAASGLGPEPPPATSEEPPPEGSPKKKKRVGWWERYREYRAEREKKHTPGVWVVWFSLAALPIFGLGQSLIDPEDLDRRRHVFWLMVLYAASALGLLVTTAFLALRRYLRQRNLEMPRAVTTVWLGSGAALTLVLLVIGAVMPGPDHGYSVLTLARAGSQEREASRAAMQGSDPGKGDGRAGSQQFDEKKGSPVDSGDKNKQGSGGQGQAKGQGRGDRKSDQGGSSKPKGEKGSGEKGEKGKADDAKRDDRDGDGKKDDSKTDKAEGASGEKARQEKSGKTTGSGSRRKASSSSGSPPPVVEGALRVLKWLVFAALAVAAIVFLMRGGLRYLANFFDWAKRLLEALRSFWENLFGRRRAAEGPAGDGEAPVERRRPLRPFRSYRNPFTDGGAESMTPAELVRYSFEALEAWAQERQLGRRDDETPLEFAERIGDEAPALAAEARRLATLYARVLYARGTLPAAWRAALEQFWERIEAVAEQPLSA